MIGWAEVRLYFLEDSPRNQWMARCAHYADRAPYDGEGFGLTPEEALADLAAKLER